MSKVGAAPGSTSTGALPRSGAGTSSGIGDGGDLSLPLILGRGGGVHGAAEQAGDGALDGLSRARRRGAGLSRLLVLLRARRLLQHRLIGSGLNVAGWTRRRLRFRLGRRRLGPKRRSRRHRAARVMFRDSGRSAIPLGRCGDRRLRRGCASRVAGRRHLGRGGLFLREVSRAGRRGCGCPILGRRFGDASLGWRRGRASR